MRRSRTTRFSMFSYERSELENIRGSYLSDSEQQGSQLFLNER